MLEPAPGHDEIARLVAPNPGPMTLGGTNTYLVAAAGQCFVVDPGPADPGHLAALREAAAERGGIAGVVLTHSHADHSEAAEMLDAPLLLGRVSAAAEGEGEEQGGDGAAPGRVGPFEVVPTPGHAADHVALMLGDVCFCGDLVLGQGSTFVPPDGGSLAAYMRSLETLRELDPELMCPGHGPWITDAGAKIAEYIEHRMDRERRLVAALASGERSKAALLDEAWSDVPAELRPAAALVMEAHLEKLAAEDRLPTEPLSG
jgi:glyoxylase-like metal-dependent hydrolase (beta-lactamase superfamily II)